MAKKEEKYKDLLSEKQNGWLLISERERKEIENTSKKYIEFLNKVKTERENVKYIVEECNKIGFVPIEEFNPEKHRGCYGINRNKMVLIGIKGSKNPVEGLNLIGAHIDSPRLDLKQNPLYEDEGIAYLKTHYYGGIKKYHWLNIPLALHGTIIKKSGEKVEIVIGEKEDEPVFIIPDLLPHLSKKLNEKKISEAFKAENLNIVLGHIPIEKDVKEAVKINILNILRQKYGITEEDFNSADIEIVPAFKAREAGIDKSLIAGYGQDDRSSAFALMESIKRINTPEKCCIGIFIDKEEIGSEGNSSIQSRYFEYFVAKFIEKINKNVSSLIVSEVFLKSSALSADVDSAYDPNYKEVFDPRNTGRLGYGVIITKYTGHGGKYDASEASAEYTGKIKKLLKENNVIFQFGEIGKIDEGGGGTIAKYLANFGMEVIDIGPPVMGMHSPYELTSKFDIYQTVKAFYTFFVKFK